MGALKVGYRERFILVDVRSMQFQKSNEYKNVQSVVLMLSSCHFII